MIDRIFEDLAGLKRWVPFRLKWNPKCEKWDKIPHNGRHGLSTASPQDWLDLPTATEAAQGYDISGVGIVLTGGIEHAGWTLVGFDYDKVSPDFIPPFDTYTELSPSKTGIRTFVWVPTPWAKRFKDTVIHPKHCDHCEVYLGTAPRFLTVTFNVIHEVPIAKLIEKQLVKLEKMKLSPRELEKHSASVPMGVGGDPVNLLRYNLSPDQTHLVNGTGKIDRSAVLHGLIIKLIDEGVSQNDVLATLCGTPALWRYCLEHRSDDPIKAARFAREEVDRAWPRTQAGMRQALIGFNSKWQIADPVPKNPEDLTFPMELFDEAPGLVGEIARWIIKSSYSPRTEFAYACALVMVSCLVGPYCTHGTRDGKLNLYMVLVGETGAGKNEAFDVMCKLLASTEAKNCISDFPASEAALRRQLNVCPNVLIRMDEIAHKLESMNYGSNGSLLGKTILEMYNGARLPPKAYADEKKSLPAVENPFVQIIAGATDKLWNVLRSSHMEDGTLNRFLFVCLNENPGYSRNFDPNADIPKELKDRMDAFFRQGKVSDLIGYVPPGFGRKIEYCREVQNARMELDKAVWDIQQQRKEYAGLYTRFIQNTLKIASILAVSTGSLVVSVENFEQARKFMKWCINNTYLKVSTKMADSNFERNSKRLLEKLAKEGGKMRVREAYKSLHLSRREMEEIMGTLVMSGEIVTTQDEGNHNGTITEWIHLV